MNISEIAQLLADRVESFCRDFYPNGVKEGNEWRVGSVEGEAGKSLGIHLRGEKAGVWCDFATGDSGDLIDLLARKRGVPIATVMAEVKQWAGVREPEFHGHQKKTYKPPRIPQCHKPKGPAAEYLTGVRKLSPEAIAAYRIGEAGREIVFPFIRDGQTVMVKVRESVDGATTKPTSAEQEPCLFGWQAIPDNARTVVICEGEIDALTLWQYGYPALSVPFGGGKGNKHAWIDTEYPNLDRFERIYLALDNDKVGDEAAETIAPRLGRHRCYRVRLPRKDANECLKAGIKSVKEYFDNAKTYDPSTLKSASAYADDVVDFFHPKPESNATIRLPWEKAWGTLDLREAELSVWWGINGHGKSQAAGQVALDAMRQGKRVCIASMEFKPKIVLGRLTRQAAAVVSGIPSIPYIRAIQEWYGDKLWMFECTGTAKTTELLETFRYAQQRYGIDLFIVDSLMKCGIGEDDYNAQKLFVEQLCDFKNEFNCHVILICHSKKVGDEHSKIGKMDIKGTGAISDLADTVVAVWRNKGKEEAQKRGETDRDNEPDCRLLCDKQRNGEGDEPWINLWFNKKTWQYTDFDGKRSRQYVDWSSNEEGAA